MATCTCRFPWLHMLGLPSRITDLCYACWSASPLSPAGSRALCHTQTATFEQEDGHCLYPRSHQKSASKETWSSLSRAAIVISSFFASSLYIKAEREPAAWCRHVVRWGAPGIGWRSPGQVSWLPKPINSTYGANASVLVQMSTESVQTRDKMHAFLQSQTPADTM